MSSDAEETPVPATTPVPVAGATGEVPKKPFLERLTGWTLAISALIGAIAGLLAAFPKAKEAWDGAYCAIKECKKSEIASSSPQTKPSTVDGKEASQGAMPTSSPPKALGPSGAPVATAVSSLPATSPLPTVKGAGTKTDAPQKVNSQAITSPSVAPTSPQTLSDYLAAISSTSNNVSKAKIRANAKKALGYRVAFGSFSNDDYSVPSKLLAEAWYWEGFDPSKNVLTMRYLNQRYDISKGYQKEERVYWALVNVDVNGLEPISSDYLEGNVLTIRCSAGKNCISVAVTQGDCGGCNLTPSFLTFKATRRVGAVAQIASGISDIMRLDGR